MTFSLLFRFLISFSFLSFSNGAVYEFIPNTNLFTSKAWTSTTCPKNRLLFGNEEPLIVYLDSNVGFREMVFPSNEEFELIFGENTGLFEDQGNDGKADGCDDYFSYKESSAFRAWHDPTSWKFLNESNALQQPLLHAELIPSQYDTAFFNPASSHKVFIDLPVRTGRLISGLFSHTTETFTEHVETIEGRMQFQLSEELEPDDFVDEIILEAYPPVTVFQKECEDQTGCITYHLNSKIEAEICKRVTDCPTASTIPCTNPIKPRGHCCNVCGGMIKFQSTTDYEHKGALNVINATLKKNAPDARFSLMKIADWQYQLILVKGRGDADFDPTWIKEKTEILKKALAERVDGVLEESLTIAYATERLAYDKVALGICLFCLICLLVGVAIVGVRKKTVIANWLIGSRIHLRALWRDEGDRIHLEIAEARGSIASASVASFENPSFKHLLAQEEDKAKMATVYEKKVPTLSYDDKSSITFTNPIFESGAKAEE